MIRGSSWFVITLAALQGCYSQHQSPTGEAVQRSAVAVQGASGPAAGAVAAAGASSKPAAQGGGGCAALRSAGSTGHTDTSAFGPVGGAGLELVEVCDRCGWEHRSDSCRALVYSVPTIDPLAPYAGCGDESFAFADCVQTQACVCSGELPAACREIKARLDACQAAQPLRDPPLPAAAGGAGVSGSCPALQVAAGPNAPDTSAFGPVGGAGFELIAVCDSCGWSHRSQACRELVEAVPTVDQRTRYDRCWDQSFAFTDCVERESCVCDGQLPTACVAIKAQLDGCLAQVPQTGAELPTAPPLPGAEGGGGMGGSCAALRDPSTPVTAQTGDFGPVGGAGFNLVGVCDRCGWQHGSESCRSLVYAVPAVPDDRAYYACLNQSLAFVGCVERERCVCSGQLPAGCSEVKSGLDACLAAAR